MIEWKSVNEEIPEEVAQESRNYYLCWNENFQYPCVRRVKNDGFEPDISHWAETNRPDKNKQPERVPWARYYSEGIFNYL